MRRIGKFPVIVVVLSFVTCGIGSSSALAADVLANGGLEVYGGPASWTLTQSITGMPAAPISAVEHVDYANEPGIVGGELGLLIKSPVGNLDPYAGENKAVNVILSQTVAVDENQTFTFTGHVFFQASASAIVDTLGAFTPLGDYNLDTVVNAADYALWRDTLGSTTDFRANGTNEGASLDIIDEADYEYWRARFGNAGHPAGVASPTESFFKVEFLNASNVVLATHMFDLRDDPTTEAWRTHTLADLVSPTGTTQARVTAGATDMVESTVPGAGQDFYFDNFSLDQPSGPSAGEKLVNGNLNTIGAPDGWVIEKTPEDNLSFSGLPEFAAHTGEVGMWLRPFKHGDAKILQTVPATEDAAYNFSAWVKLQWGYAGFDPESGTETFMTMEFLDASSAVIGTETLDLFDVVPFPGEENPQGVWQQVSVNGTAPTDTVSVRVSAGATGMVSSTLPADPQSALFDDFALLETLPGAGSLATTVPEPSSVVLLGIAVALAGPVRRRPGQYGIGCISVRARSEPGRPRQVVVLCGVRAYDSTIMSIRRSCP